MRISDWSSDVCSSDLGLAGLAVEPRAAPSAERRAGYSQQQRVENGAVDASGHRHACARDGEDDEVERLVDRTLFRRGLAQQDRKRVVVGKRVAVSVRTGCRRIIKKKIKDEPGQE